MLASNVKLLELFISANQPVLGRTPWTELAKVPYEVRENITTNPMEEWQVAVTHVHESFKHKLVTADDAVFKLTYFYQKTPHHPECRASTYHHTLRQRAYRTVQHLADELNKAVRFRKEFSVNTNGIRGELPMGDKWLVLVNVKTAPHNRLRICFDHDTHPPSTKENRVAYFPEGVYMEYSNEFAVMCGLPKTTPTQPLVLGYRQGVHIPPVLGYTEPCLLPLITQSSDLAEEKVHADQFNKMLASDTRDLSLLEWVDVGETHFGNVTVYLQRNNTLGIPSVLMPTVIPSLILLFRKM